ncbi:MAG: 2-amino-4-hydroxy-6-hydroxymethyldihydropteridine diphosphokinase [Bacteroidota bacterium]
MNYAYLLTGGNLGDRTENLHQAEIWIDRQAGRVIKKSALYETAAWGNVLQPDYLNQAILVETNLTAIELLRTLLQIEKQLGRLRQEKYGARIIDIDLLFFNNEIIHLPNLSVPHPQLQNRRFVLVPMTEIAPQFVHPQLKKTIETLLSSCPDPLDVKKFYATNGVK